jgi:Mg2+/Co2+ transporter CorB
MSSDFYLIIISILIVASAFFSCVETAITALSRARIHRLKLEGNKRAKKLEKLLQEKEKVISAMLIGNNAINIIVSALTTSFLIDKFGEDVLLYSTFCLTILILIFAEITPKTLALKAPDSIALFFVYPIDFSVKILFPFTHLIQKIVNFFVDLISIRSKKRSKSAEFAEIRDTINLKAKEGSIYKYDKDLIDGVLDLSDTIISEIMVHRKDIESINFDLSKSEIIKLATSSLHSRIPLWKENKENIVGILNVRKLLKLTHFHQTNFNKLDFELVISKPWFVPENNSLRTQLFSFRKKRNRIAMVVNEYGSLVGLITLEDILEEIVGDIKDEEEIDIIKTKSGIYKISGKTLIRDINKKLDWNLDENKDAYTISAFVINSLGRIPDEKENFTFGNYYFEIVKKKGEELVLIKIKNYKS